MTAWRWAAPLLTLALAGCDLNEITVADARDLVVAEVLMQVGQNTNRIIGFLHRSDTGGGGSSLVPDADIRLTVNQRGVIQLFAAEPEDCVVEPEHGDRASGTCYVANPAEALRLRPGDTVALTIQLPDGGRLLGETVVSGDFQVVSPDPMSCSIAPLRNHEVRWTSSIGTWAYLAETRIDGLQEALSDTPIDVEPGPLDLLGLAISAADTSIVFPSEFGIFERFDLDRDLALLLQEGLPQGARATVVIGAIDRNWVNWVRGGDFNPSGQVRVPSVRGDGTGVFGSVVRRTVRFSADPSSAFPPCGG